jgi:thiol-disulfide isomerase/thioredoxin
MKKIVLVTIVIFYSGMAFCQYDTTPPYLKEKLIPELNLLTLDSTFFSTKKLQAGKYTIIMMYNPECGHCQTQMELFLSMPEVMSEAQIIIASTLPIYKIKLFCEKYKLANYANIYPLKDNSWFLGKFFQPKTIPVLAFYNKQNQFTFISQGNATKEQILEALKK